MTVMVEQEVAEQDGVGVMKRADTINDCGQLVSQGLVLMLQAISSEATSTMFLAKSSQERSCLLA